jgi:hypothetical protein
LCAVGVGPKGIQPTNVACPKGAWGCVKAMMPQPVGHVAKQFVLSLAEHGVIEIVNVEQIDVAWLPEPSLDEVPRGGLRNDKVVVERRKMIGALLVVLLTKKTWSGEEISGHIDQSIVDAEVRHVLLCHSQYRVK